MRGADESRRRHAGVTAPVLVLTGLLMPSSLRVAPPVDPGAVLGPVDPGAVLGPVARGAVGAAGLIVARPGVSGIAGMLPDPTVPAASSDSADLLASLQREQRRVERVRRRHMRTVIARRSRCDEIVGRFCLWHEPEETWKPPPEPPEVARAREKLLGELAAAAEFLPGDAWIAGQRVRYLQESGRDAEALRAARACRAPDPGWCSALVGFALHGAGRYEKADFAFRRALREMPPEVRCDWSDASDLLDRRARKTYRKLSCAERAAFEARLWWLADPLYLTAGNERRTEHLWRRVMDRLQDDAASGYGLGWGDDLRELLMRYGWPAGWERTRSRPGSLAFSGGSTVAHDPPGSRRFVPSGRFLEQPGGIGPGEWELDPRRPRSHYAPAYAREFDPLRVQVARFRRGDTAIVVASPSTWEGPEGTCEDARLGLFLGLPAERTLPARGRPGRSAGAVEGGDEAAAVVARAAVRERATGGDPVGLSVALPAAAGREVLVSVESLCEARRRAARARFGIEVPDVEPAISDVLLGREAGRDAPASTLADAARAARPPGPLRRGERVPLYWEVYGARGTEATSVKVELVRRGGGVLRTLVGWTGLLGERSALVGMRWVDRRPAPGVWARSVVLGIPEQAPEGEYELVVTVRLDGGIPLRTSRRVRIEAGRGDRE